jgi:CBS domain containing-hemolysin-like protein
MKLNKSQKLEIEKFKKQNKKRQIEKSNYKWVIQTTLMAFIISLIFSFISEITIPNVNIYIGIVLLITFILIGIIFDIIGIAVASADVKPFHSMNAKKVKGSDIAVELIKNAAKVSSFCNDVVGDICGIISGSASAIISVIISTTTHINIFVVTLVTTSLIAALTIGGKALGKTFAINKSNIIIYESSKFISYFYKLKK